MHARRQRPRVSLKKLIHARTHIGNHVLDTVQMGATLDQTYYFARTTSSKTIGTIAESNTFRDANLIVKVQDDSQAQAKTSIVNGDTVTYAATSIRRIGEFSTYDSQGAAVPLADDCRIGTSIVPQIIVYNIRPLWDIAIPYEYFMSQSLSNRFREYLANTTLTFLQMMNNCTDANGESCVANNGTCITVRALSWALS